MNGNWWIRLSAIQTLFAREHNAIVDRLRSRSPRQGRRVAFSEGAPRQRPRSSPRSTRSNGHRRSCKPQPCNMRCGAHGTVCWAKHISAPSPAARRASERHPEFSAGALCGAVRDHRGVHRGLPSALADSRRLLLPPPPRRPRITCLHALRHVRRRNDRRSSQGAVQRRSLFARHELCRRAGPAQLSRPSAATAGKGRPRHLHRPCDHRHFA